VLTLDQFVVPSRTIKQAEKTDKQNHLELPKGRL
jgi:hypothetical protein